jgi:hypothetical protein
LKTAVAAAAPFLLALLAGCATTPAIPADILGSYELVAHAQGPVSSPGHEWIELNHQGTWEKSYVGVSLPRSWGTYVVRGRDDGCTQLDLRPDPPAEGLRSAEVCQGTLTVQEHAFGETPRSVAGIASRHPLTGSYLSVYEKRR